MKLTGLDKYVIFSIGFTILYTTVVIILTCFGVNISDVLTECVYRFFVGEVIVCALIKVFKIVPMNNLKSKLDVTLNGLLGSGENEVDS